VEAGSIQPGAGGADIAPLLNDGVPGLAVRTIATHYFDYHHSRADTVDKVKPEDLRAKHRGHGGDGVRAGGYAGDACSRRGAGTR
jgi:hypothetical protein